MLLSNISLSDAKWFCLDGFRIFQIITTRLIIFTPLDYPSKVAFE